MFYFALDVMDAVWLRRDPLVPPRRLVADVGGEDFKQFGEWFLGCLKELGGLRSNENVLDVGCGVGRIAVPLTKYLDRWSRYEGFDIAREAIKWCRANITPSYPNFNFRLADVRNPLYNPRGTCEASEYKFPYKNESFDFVFLYSVFTHMVAQQVENYSSEVARVLKRNGRCLITFFLLNPEVLELLEKKSSDYDFGGDTESCCRIARHRTDFAVAYEEKFVRSLYRKVGLEILEPVHYGSWCGRQNFFSFQDVVVARKRR